MKNVYNINSLDILQLPQESISVSVRMLWLNFLFYFMMIYNTNKLSSVTKTCLNVLNSKYFKYTFYLFIFTTWPLFPSFLSYQSFPSASHLPHHPLLLRFCSKKCMPPMDIKQIWHITLNAGWHNQLWEYGSQKPSKES